MHTALALKISTDLHGARQNPTSIRSGLGTTRFVPEFVEMFLKRAWKSIK